MSFRTTACAGLAALVFSFVTASAPAQTSALSDGTPVQLRVTDLLSSSFMEAGDKVLLDVAEDIILQNRLIVAKGGVVFATVAEAEPHKGHTRDGKLVLHIDFLMLADGEPVEVRLNQNSSAPTRQNFAATNQVDLHESAFLQATQGKDVGFAPGTPLIAYTVGDMQLDLARFDDPASQNKDPMTRLVITSSPNQAEVNVDGKFISDTPAVVGLSRGTHLVTVRLAGYNYWQETMHTSGGMVKRSIRLEQDGSAGSTLSNCWGGSDCSDTVGNVAAASRAVRSTQSNTDPSGK